MNVPEFDEDSFRKKRRRAVHALRERQKRQREASLHFEFIAQAHDVVVIEELSRGCFREFSLQHGAVRTRGLRWQDRCEPLIDWIEARLDRWEMRRVIRRRNVRDRKMRLAVERRLHPQAFVCRLYGDLLR